jgi:hypothetical protein
VAVPGKTLTFTVAGVIVGQGTTDSTGTATFSYLIPAGTASGAETITVKFAGDVSFQASTGTGTLTVQ